MAIIPFLKTKNADKYGCDSLHLNVVDLCNPIDEYRSDPQPVEPIKDKPDEDRPYDNGPADDIQEALFDIYYLKVA